MDIAAWLRGLGLEQYEPALAACLAIRMMRTAATSKRPWRGC